MRHSLHFAFFVTSLGTLGCFQSHQREGERDVGLIDARAVDARAVDARAVDAEDICRFFYVSPSGASVDCTLATDSVSACTDAARCICAATEPSDVEMCVRWETEPRAQITFSDFCARTPPARMAMDQALRAYLGSRGDLATITGGCASIPALLP